MHTAAFLGIDIGTSGIRGCCIDADKNELASHHIAFPASEPTDGRNEQDPAPWLTGLDELLNQLSRLLQQLDRNYQITAISIDGTSSTLIACKQDGTALSPALMYNDQQSCQQAEKISHFAPAESAVHGASSSLSKALFLLEKYPATEIFCHQADWLAASFTGKYGISDDNNCLKLGYDSISQNWPQWLLENNLSPALSKDLLPQVVPPGTIISELQPAFIEKYHLAENCHLIAGTTDSNAAVLATGASKIGDAVTSLGSTLVIKAFSDKPLFAPDYGIYSHRLLNNWLVGGASNSGGSTLLQYFTTEQLNKMTPQLKPEQPTGLNYYPLPASGERFPVNDSAKKNNTTPRPSSDVEFFQGLLEGMAAIEAEGYNKLQTLGVSKPERIFTAGGGSKNPAWEKIRQQAIGIKILTAVHSEASYGSALLAHRGYTAR